MNNFSYHIKLSADYHRKHKITHVFLGEIKTVLLKQRRLIYNSSKSNKITFVRKNIKFSTTLL